MSPEISVPIGNIKLLEHDNKTAFLTSRGTTENSFDAIRKWLDGLSSETDCVLIGNLQQVESYVFRGLLKRGIPTVLVMCAPYPKVWPTYIVEAIGDGKLLILTTYGFSVPWEDEGSKAEERNKYMIANSERVVVGIMRPNGSIAEQIVGAKEVVELNEWHGPLNGPPGTVG